MNNNALIEKIETLVKPIADELNYEIYHIEFVKENNEFYLRIYIDKEEGISLTDCEALSRRVSDVLDVEDPIDKAYYLEVSSPGLDRPLFTLEQFQRYVGEDIAVHLRIPVLDRRKWQGKLEKIENDMLTLIVDGQEQVLIFGNIQKANVIAKF